MTPPQCNDPAAAPTEPFRWEAVFVTDAFDHFRDSAHGSQRQYARDHGIPRSTLGSWLRQDPADSDLDPQLAAFFRSACGLRFLRRLVLALFVVFLFRGAC